MDSKFLRKKILNLPYRLNFQKLSFLANVTFKAKYTKGEEFSRLLLWVLFLYQVTFNQKTLQHMHILHALQKEC